MSEHIDNLGTHLERPTNLEPGETFAWAGNVLVRQGGSLIEEEIVQSLKPIDDLYQSPSAVVRKLARQSNLKEVTERSLGHTTIKGIIELNAALGQYDGLQALVVDQAGESITIDVKGITCPALNEYYDQNTDENLEPAYPSISSDDYDKYIAIIIDRNANTYPYSAFRALLVSEEDAR